MTKNATLWVLQVLLALGFLFFGGIKLVAPPEQMIAPGPLQYPVLFLRLIGGCEILGAIAMILPGLTGIKRELTPIAAACLVVIMIGATVTNLVNMPSYAIPTVILGVMAAVVAYGRWRGTSGNIATAART